MPEIIFDGRKITAENGDTIIQAAYKNGFEIPHFCWHPELSIAGNCRMCLVEVGIPKRNPDGSMEVDAKGNPNVNYFPKLQIACATPVSEGMHVRSVSEKAVHAQEAVMEFLLINHPLDCPICDEAGECKLQEYAFKHSRGESRFDEIKNRKEKRQVWGPNVMYDAERCISCSRCIRYAQEEAKQDVLTFVQRGDHVTIKLFDGTKWDNPYSMNVIEICPVGALTSEDFRFKARVWDMSFNPSITPADDTGANTYLGVLNNEILRVQPRTNMFVNRYWLTDEQRLNHIEKVNHDRIIEPMIRRENNLEVVTWEEALSFGALELAKFKSGEVMFLLSPKATTECNYALSKFAKKVVKSPNIDYLEHIDKTIKNDDFLISNNKAPNSRGIKAIGIKSEQSTIKAAELAQAINSGRIKALYLMEEFFDYSPELIDALGKLELLIVHSYNHNKVTEKAHIVFATSTYAEVEGTYINRKNRVQHVSPALVTRENRASMGMKMSRLDKFGAPNDRWTQHEDRNSRQSWRIITALANKMGAGWTYKKSEDIFREIATSIEDFKALDYAKLDRHQGIQLGKGNNPDPIKVNYHSHTLKPYL